MRRAARRGATQRRAQCSAARRSPRRRLPCEDCGAHAAISAPRPRSAPRSVSRRHGQHGVYYVAHSAPTPHEREVDAALGGFFNLIFLLMVVFQFCIMLWRAHSPKTYTAVTLGGLWLFPLGFAEYFHLWTFLSTVRVLRTLA